MSKEMERQQPWTVPDVVRSKSKGTKLRLTMTKLGPLKKSLRVPICSQNADPFSTKGSAYLLNKILLHPPLFGCSFFGPAFSRGIPV